MLPFTPFSSHHNITNSHSEREECSCPRVTTPSRPTSPLIILNQTLILVGKCQTCFVRLVRTSCNTIAQKFSLDTLSVVKTLCVSNRTSVILTIHFVYPSQPHTVATVTPVSVTNTQTCNHFFHQTNESAKIGVFCSKSVKHFWKINFRSP